MCYCYDELGVDEAAPLDVWCRVIPVSYTTRHLHYHLYAYHFKLRLKVDTCQTVLNISDDAIFVMDSLSALGAIILRNSTLSRMSIHMQLINLAYYHQLRSSNTILPVMRSYYLPIFLLKRADYTVS